MTPQETGKISSNKYQGSLGPFEVGYGELIKIPGGSFEVSYWESCGGSSQIGLLLRRSTEIIPLTGREPGLRLGCRTWALERIWGLREACGLLTALGTLKNACISFNSPDDGVLEISLVRSACSSLALAEFLGSEPSHGVETKPMRTTTEPSMTGRGVTRQPTPKTEKHRLARV